MSKSLSSEDGERISLRLHPPLAAAEIDALERELPCALPPEVRELLTLCRGFEGGLADFVDFTGKNCLFEYEPAFPHGLPIAADGYGNFWVVDLLPSSNAWGPIYFVCHDAPIILYQSPTLEHFLIELFKSSEPPYRSLINDVHDDRLFQVWQKNPGVKSQSECAASGEAALQRFAGELDPSFQIVDLRNAAVGGGFSWGRYGPDTVVRRFGELPIFAYRKPGR